MPFCRSCGSRISKFDKNICPVCGEKHPLEGSYSDTVDITTELDLKDKEVRKSYQAHFRSHVVLYFSLLGWSGLPFFYLKFKKMGYIWLVANLVFLAGLMLIFILAISPKSWVSYVAPIAIIYLLNILTGIYFLVKKDLKDGNGEFIR